MKITARFSWFQTLWSERQERFGKQFAVARPNLSRAASLLRRRTASAER